MTLEAPFQFKVTETGPGARREMKYFPLRVLILICILVAIGATSAVGWAQEKPTAAPAPLLAGLRSKDKGDRRDAANQLGSMRARGAVRALVEVLSDKEATVREAAAFALGQISDPAATALLIPLLGDSNDEVRVSAAFALGMIADRKSAQALSHAVGDRDPEVRSSAIFALGLMQDEQAVDEIAEALDDPSFDVRYDAVWALGQIGEPDVEERLRDSLVSLNLLRIDGSRREAFRQVVQYSLESLRTEAHARTSPGDGGRPRRATGIVRDERYAPPTRPMGIHRSARPAATEVALRARALGSVKLRVLVGADGKAVRVYVTRRLGYGLDRRAVETALRYRFDPEIQSGLPQSSWTDVEVKF